MSASSREIGCIYEKSLKMYIFILRAVTESIKSEDKLSTETTMRWHKKFKVLRCYILILGWLGIILLFCKAYRCFSGGEAIEILVLESSFFGIKLDIIGV